jgi:DNA-binding Lrp family transcriptional regulator
MSETRPWTFLSNHAHVLVAISRDPGLRLREIADLVGITERSASSIVNDLEDGGFLIRERIGRNNRYKVVPDIPLRHPLEDHRSIGDLLDFLKPPKRKRKHD